MEKIKRHFHHNIARIIELKSKPIFQQFSWNLLGTIITNLISFVSVFVVFRYFGPINVGLTTFIQNYLIGLFMILAGMDNYFYWNVLKYEGGSQINYLLKYSKMRGVLAFILGSIGLIFSFIFLPDDLFILSIVSILPSLLSSALVPFLSYLWVYKKAKVVSIAGIAQGIILFIIKMIMVYLEAPILWFVFVNGIEILSVISFYYVLKNKYFKIKDLISIEVSLNDFKLLFISTLPGIFFVISHYLIFRVDQIYLYITSNAETVGLYAGAVKIVELSNIFLGALMATVAPYIASSYKNIHQPDIKEKKDEKILLKWFMLSAVLMTIFVMLFTPYIIKILYGNRFEDSIPILFYYALTIMPAFVMNYYANVYPARAKYISISIIYLIACVLNIIGIIILYPIFNVIGVAIATVIAYIVGAVASYCNGR